METFLGVPIGDWYTLATFAQGVVFFTLALMVFVINYLGERIKFSRSLEWLGLFALGEALVAWNQALALHLVVTALPLYLHLVAMVFAYALLLAYGVSNVLGYEPSGQGQERRPFWGPRTARRWWAVVVGAVLLGTLGVLWVLSSSQRLAYAPQVETGVRLLLGVPGGMLSAWGLRQQSYARLLPEQRKAIRTYLRMAEGALLGFGLLNLFPLPHSAWTTWGDGMTLLTLAAVLRTLCGLVLASGISRALFSLWQRIQEWVEVMEREQALMADRERISRDLHDGIIQSIYAAGLMLEGVEQTLGEDPNKARAQLRRVMDGLNETIQEVRRYIFDLRGGPTDATLEQGIERLLRDFRINTLLETDFKVHNRAQHTLNLERRRHLFQIVREALSNTARHARAQKVEVHLFYNEDSLELIIRDDGVGMQTLELNKGHGLRNIRERARLLDGALHIESAPNEGVQLRLTVPY